MGVAGTPGACSAGVTETDHMDEDSVAGTCVGSLADSPWVDSIAPARCRVMQTVAVLMMFWRPGTDADAGKVLCSAGGQHNTPQIHRTVSSHLPVYTVYA